MKTPSPLRRLLLAALCLLAVGFVCSAHAAYVTKSGTKFNYNGAGIAFKGATFYPSFIGGTGEWHKSSFTSYIDQMIAMAKRGNMNLLRPTDFFFKNTPGQDPYDPVLWSNMDYLCAQCRANGLFVVMDISAYRWLLESDGKDSINASNWYAFIDFVAARYRTESAIAFNYIMGEPASPQTTADADNLVTFFTGVCNRYRSDDANHLICAGGFNHMEDSPSLQWWQRIYAIANNDIGGYKTYSQNDLNYITTVTGYTNSINKPSFQAEFGMPQGQGDGTWSGTTYNGINTDRADFFNNVYTGGKNGGTQGYVFWNMGEQVGSTSYNVADDTSPATWAVIANFQPGSTASTVFYEAESLSFTYGGAGSAAVNNDSLLSGGHGVQETATGTGAQVTFAVPIPVGNISYKILLGVKKSNNRGQYQFATASTPTGPTWSNHGAPIDLYNSSALVTELDLGTITFGSAPTKGFRFTVTGKNASSSGYNGVFDYIKLVPQ